MNSSSLDVFMKNYEDAANSRDFNKVQKFVSDDARSLVRRIQQEFGVTAIIVSHDPSDIFSLAEEVAVIAKGDLIQVATPKELYERPKNLKVAGSLGDINILDGKIIQSEGKYDLEITGLATVKGLIDSVEDLPGSIKVGIRPEDIVLVPKKRPLTDFSESKNTEDVLENLGDLTVDSSNYSQGTFLISLLYGDGKYRINGISREALLPGEILTIFAKRNKIKLFNADSGDFIDVTAKLIEN